MLTRNTHHHAIERAHVWTAGDGTGVTWRHIRCKNNMQILPHRRSKQTMLFWRLDISSVFKQQLPRVCLWGLIDILHLFSCDSGYANASLWDPCADAFSMNHTNKGD